MSGRVVGFPTLTKLRERGAEIGKAWADVMERNQREGKLADADCDGFVKDALEYFRSEARQLIAAGQTHKAARAYFEGAETTFRARLVKLDRQQHNALKG